jgi:cell division protein FtsX
MIPRWTGVAALIVSVMAILTTLCGIAYSASCKADAVASELRAHKEGQAAFEASVLRSLDRIERWQTEADKKH